MARFFSHGEIASRQLPTVKDIGWLAGQIANLPPFKDGSAVLCGSVAWGTHTARSDIDIAHFGTVKHPQIERAIQPVLALYEERTKQRLIAPRIDVITVGIEATATPGAKAKSNSITGGDPAPAGLSVNGVFVKARNSSAIFADTFVRFTDHIGSLAQVKGGVWQKFLDNHLSPPRKDYRKVQREGIRSYVTTTTTAWEVQPLHALNLRAREDLTQQQLDLISQAENYAVNLMRRILGELGSYPRPDRIGDIRRAFDKLEQPWAKRIAADAESFFALDAQYKAIVTEVRKTKGALTGASYRKRLASHFESLPFARIQEAVWEYLEQR